MYVGTVYQLQSNLFFPIQNPDKSRSQILTVCYLLFLQALENQSKVKKDNFFSSNVTFKLTLQ